MTMPASSSLVSIREANKALIHQRTREQDVRIRSAIDGVVERLDFYEVLMKADRITPEVRRRHAQQMVAAVLAIAKGGQA